MRKLFALLIVLAFTLSCANSYVANDNNIVKNDNKVLAVNDQPTQTYAQNQPAPKPVVTNTPQPVNSDIQVVNVEGYGNIFQGEKLIARDAAVKDALRNAVEQVVGTMISSQSKVENYQLISDVIYSKSQGFVQKYEIISEAPEGTTYHIKVKAFVSKSGVKDKLMALHLLMVQQNMPRVVVFLKQNMYGEGWSYYGDQNSMAEEKLKEILVGKGFFVIDKAQAQKSIDRTSLIAASNGDVSAAQKLALMLKAEVIITGKVVGNVKTNNLYGGYLSASLNVSLNAIKSDTGKIIAIASGSRNLAPVSDKINGINKVSDILIPSITENLITKIMSKWASGSTYVHITLNNVSYSDYRDFGNFCKERIRMVANVYKRGFTGGVASLDLETKKGGAEIADEISLRESALPFKIEIVDVAKDSLILKKVVKK
ncbi:flagellar assembly protein T N-terminal domain-containing protein [bacterium]|nr:flagellar assembly protein T N-terminal domain-containing protein [bacterium]